MSKFLVKCAFYAGAILALGVTANAASYSLPGTSVVIPVGDRDSYYRPDVNAYGPTILHDDDSHLYQPDTAGADEIRELQRAFPQTNWPSSMRYYERP